MLRVLKDDTFSRRQGSTPAGPRASRGQSGPALVACMLASLALMALSRLDHSLVRGARGLLADTMSPVLKVAMVPFQPLQRGARTLAELFDLQQEADQLKLDNQRLKGWEARAKELERRMTQLETLARVVPEDGLTFATARVIADGSGPFVRAALLDAGRGAGFKSGYPVINVDGLVGRIIEAGQRSSRLLMLTDLNSRVPVYIGASSVRAMLLGDNGTFPKLAHIPADATVEAGDDVFTSGVGGVFPRGLRIGVVVDVDGMLRVELHARLDRLEYVSILFFDQPGRDMADDEPLADRRPGGPRKRGTQPLETGSVAP